MGHEAGVGVGVWACGRGCWHVTRAGAYIAGGELGHMAEEVAGGGIMCKGCPSIP